MNKSHKLPVLEGLRGVAAFVVVIWHLRLTFFANSSADIRLHLAFMPHVAARLSLAVIEGLYNGTFAVWLFWIMSGFVLSLQFFLRAHHTPPAAAHDYLEEALLRRYPRLLLPVLASVCFAYLLHRFHLMRNLPFAEMLGNHEASWWVEQWYTFPASALGALKSAIWQCFFAYDITNSYNNVLWTMEPEFYGSLFLFSFLGLFGHRSSRFLAYPLIVLASHLLILDWLIAFVGGIALCDLFVNRARLPLAQTSPYWSVFRRACNHRGLTALFWLSIITGVGLPNYRGTFHILLGLAAVLMTLVSSPTQRVLASAIPMFLGRISFGLYLVHIPIICSFSCGAYLALFKSLGHTEAALLVSAATVVLSMILGYLLYLFADHPGVRWSRTFASFVMRAPRNALRRTEAGGQAALHT